MGTYTFTEQIQAPPEAVFDLWTDVDRMGEWIEGVRKVADVRGANGETGSRYTLWFGPMASPTTILAAERPRHVRTRFGNALLRGETDVTFEPSRGGTALKQVFQVEGLIPRVAARIWATGSYKGSFRGELKSFARIAERQARED